jgi:hypothetical protein
MNKPNETTDTRPPRPTYVPAAMALSIMFTVWGINTHWLISAAGIGLMTWSLWAWIREIRHSWRSS